MLLAYLNDVCNGLSKLVGLALLNIRELPLADASERTVCVVERRDKLIHERIDRSLRHLVLRCQVL